MMLSTICWKLRRGGDPLKLAKEDLNIKNLRL